MTDSKTTGRVVSQRSRLTRGTRIMRTGRKVDFYQGPDAARAWKERLVVHWLREQDKECHPFS